MRCRNKCRVVLRLVLHQSVNSFWYTTTGDGSATSSDPDDHTFFSCDSQSWPNRGPVNEIAGVQLCVCTAAGNRRTKLPINFYWLLGDYRVIDGERRRERRRPSRRAWATSEIQRIPARRSVLSGPQSGIDTSSHVWSCRRIRHTTLWQAIPLLYTSPYSNGRSYGSFIIFACRTLRDQKRKTCITATDG